MPESAPGRHQAQGGLPPVGIRPGSEDAPSLRPRQGTVGQHSPPTVPGTPQTVSSFQVCLCGHLQIDHPTPHACRGCSCVEFILLARIRM